MPEGAFVRRKFGKKKKKKGGGIAKLLDHVENDLHSFPRFLYYIPYIGMIVWKWLLMVYYCCCGCVFSRPLLVGGTWHLMPLMPPLSVVCFVLGPDFGGEP